MKQKINLTIAKPCSEKFDLFKKTETGGFCKQCNAEVVDFRNMSDGELAEFFKPKPENTCGVFRTPQVGSSNNFQSAPQKTGYSNLLRIAAITVFSMFSFHGIQAQVNNNVSDKVSKTTETQNRLLAGVVSDESGPLPGANIMLKDSNIGTTTNFDGEYEFPKPLYSGDVLIVSYLGYETQEIKVTANQSELNVLIPNDSYVLMGKVDVNEIYSSKKSLWKTLKDKL